MTDDARSNRAEDDSGDWLEEFEAPTEPPPALEHELIRIERAESVTRLVVGGLVILAGLVLFGLGLAGLVAWGFDGLGVDPEVQTSAAGMVIALIGLLVIGLTRPKIRITPTEADEARR